jgi:hypothetical protein
VLPKKGSERHYRRCLDKPTPRGCSPGSCRRKLKHRNSPDPHGRAVSRALGADRPASLLEVQKRSYTDRPASYVRNISISVCGHGQRDGLPIWTRTAQTAASDEDIALATFEGFAAAGQDAADRLSATVTARDAVTGAVLAMFEPAEAPRAWLQEPEEPGPLSTSAAMMTA